METLYWKTFITVAELGSFSDAARRLHITQSAVSRRIAALESHCGVRLLDRTGGTVNCSPAGRAVVDTARGILALEHKIVKDLCNVTAPRQVSLGCTPNFGATFLPPIMGLLAQMDQTVNLSVEMKPTLGVLEDYRLGRLDVAIFEHCQTKGLQLDCSIELCADEVVFVSSVGCGIPAGDVGIEALLEQTLFCCGPRCCTRSLLNNNLEQIGLSVSSFSRLVQVTDLHFLTRSVIEQGGVSFVSRRLVEPDIAAGRLVPHRVSGFHHSRSVILAARDPCLIEEWKAHFEAVSDPPLDAAPEHTPCACHTPDEPSQALS